jgi:uncharacterized membrane protein YqjE
MLGTLPVAAPGLLASARAVLGLLIEMGCTRVQLASVELEQERLRLAGLCMLAVATMFLFGVTLVLCGLLLVLVFWDGPRLLVACLVAAFFVCSSAALAWRWRLAQQRRPPFLTSTLATLREDRESLLGAQRTAP